MILKDKVRIILATTAFPISEKTLPRSLLKKMFTSQKVSLRSVLSRLVNRGEVEKIISPTGVGYRLTRRGIDQLKMDYPFFKFQEKEEGVYLLLFYFPERLRRYRDKLRQVVQNEGWLPLATSVYFSPWPPSKFLLNILKDKRWSDRLIIVKAEVLEGQLVNLFKERLNLDEIYAKFIAFISQADGVISLFNNENSPVKWDKIALDALERFYDLLELKIYLPSAIWSTQNLATQSWEHFRSIIEKFQKEKS